MRAGEVETSLNLSDGALHIGSRQSLGEAGEGHRHNKQLGKMKGNISHQNRLIIHKFNRQVLHDVNVIF